MDSPEFGQIRAKSRVSSTATTWSWSLNGTGMAQSLPQEDKIGVFRYGNPRKEPNKTRLSRSSAKIQMWLT